MVLESLKPSHLLIGCILCVFIYQIHKKEETYAFMIFLVLGLCAAYYYIDNTTLNSAISDPPKMNADSLEMPSNIYKTYKHPVILKYSQRIPDYFTIIKAFDFVYKYDKQKMNQVKAYGEHFFKTHFNIMIGEYDPKLYISDLYDSKHKMIETLQELVYVLPKVSRILNLKNIDQFVYQQINKLNALLSRYIKIVHHAYPQSKIGRYYEPPFEDNAL